MRRSALKRLALFGAVAAASAFTAGCEDGPNQTFSPAPPGAANLWNNGGTDASYNDPATQDFDAGGGGTNAVNICTAAQQSAAWSTAFLAPIVPPFSAGGMDLSTGGTFSAFTIEMAEHGVTASAGVAASPQLCQGAAYSPCGECCDGSGNPGYAWGPGNQLQTCYDVATHQLTFFEVQQGYDGTVTFKLPANYNGTPVPYNTAGKDLTYVWHIGVGVTEDDGTGAKTFDMGWSPIGVTTAAANKMYLGLMYTFQPTLIAITNAPLNEMTDVNYNCLASSKCRTSANGDGSGGNFGVRPVGVYFDAAQSNSGNLDTASAPSDIYMYPVKFEPYSLAPYNEGLDYFIGPNTDPARKTLPVGNTPGTAVYGPYAPAGPLSPPGTATPAPFCTLYMGATWSDFTTACVNVTGNTTLDGLSLAKLLGAQHHTSEWYTFSVVGVNQNFSADTAELTQNGLPSVLSDSAGSLANPPHGDDVATDFIVDVRASGAVLNDQRGDVYPAVAGVTANDIYEDTHLAGQDFHGSGAILSYYRHLVFTDIVAQMKAFGGTPATDPTTCQGTDNDNPAAYVAPAGCTGFEQLASMSAPAGSGTWEDALDLGAVGYYKATAGALGAQRSFFRPGDPYLAFLFDPAGANTAVDALITAPNLFQASLLQVTAVLGHGNIQNLPPATRDWRYYLQFWAQAFMKYQLNRSQNPTWVDLANNTAKVKKQINYDNLFYDLNNGLDKFEYVDRSQALVNGAPTDFEYDVLLLSSNVQDNNYYQRLTRAENALYTSMLGSIPQNIGGAKTDPPGSNANVFLSDLFGAPGLGYYINNGLWGDALDATGTPIPGKDGYYCTTTLFPKNCVGAACVPGCLGASCEPDPECTQSNPVNAPGGQPLNQPPRALGLPGAPALLDGQGQLMLTNYPGIFRGTAWTLGNSLPINQTLPYIASALIDVPSYDNPYDTTSNNTVNTTLVPWIPYQSGNGFEIPINAERSQFIQTGSLDFTGVTITTNIDYLPETDATTGKQSAKIVAVETQDFLGEVVLCTDPESLDILRVKMYGSVLDILSWFDTHPQARAACGIYVRNSPYNNYADVVTSTINGITLGINPGAGGGPARISDATLFLPSLLTQTQ